VWRDWALVAALIPVAVLEGVIRDDLVWRVASVAVAVALLPTLLWRRTHPLAAVVVAFGLLTVVDVVSLAVGVDWRGLDTIFVVLLIYSLFRWASGRHAMIGLAVLAIPLLLSGFDAQIHSQADEIPANSRAERRPPARVGNEMVTLLPVVLETVTRVAEHEQPGRGRHRHRSDHDEQGNDGGFGGDDRRPAVGNGEADVDRGDQGDRQRMHSGLGEPPDGEGQRCLRSAEDQPPEDGRSHTVHGRLRTEVGMGHRRATLVHRIGVGISPLPQLFGVASKRCVAAHWLPLTAPLSQATVGRDNSRTAAVRRRVHFKTLLLWTPS
jgi:hypothetical protein